MGKSSGKELEQLIILIIKKHVQTRNPRYACLVVAGAKLRDIGYLNPSNIKELVYFIETSDQKIILNFDLEVELKELNRIDRLTINDLIKKAQFCVCVK